MAGTPVKPGACYVLGVRSPIKICRCIVGWNLVVMQHHCASVWSRTDEGLSHKPVYELLSRGPGGVCEQDISVPTRHRCRPQDMTSCPSVFGTLSSNAALVADLIRWITRYLAPNLFG